MRCIASRQIVPNAPYREVKRESRNTDTFSSSGIDRFWADFPRGCLSAHDGVVAFRMAVESEPNGIRANDPRGLRDPRRLFAHRFAQPDAARELDLVHCFLKLSAWRDYGGPSDEHAHRTRPSVRGRSCPYPCSVCFGPADTPRSCGSGRTERTRHIPIMPFIRRYPILVSRRSRPS